MIRLIRQYHKTLSAVSPKTAANSAFNLFRKVRIKKIKPAEQPFYDEAKETVVDPKGKKIVRYEFGNPENDIVILLHGWDSNVGCMYKFVAPLLAKDKYVLGFNLPGHAFDTSNTSNIYQAKELFKKFMYSIPKGRKISIISHSFGSGVVGYGLSELDIEIDTLVFLTTPNKVINIFTDFKKLIGLNDKAFSHLCETATDIIGENVENLSISEKLKTAQFNHLHLFHNSRDKVLPYKNSVEISDEIPNSTLHTLVKMGHYKMLWNEELVEMVMEVVK